MSIFIDFHVLQTVPPSCVNRDDTGSPKTAVYGGAVRARVSSQAWKHAMRKKFKELFRSEELGSRTKNVVEMVEHEICAIDSSVDDAACHKKAIEVLTLAGIKLKSEKDKPEKADALFFMSNKQAKALAECALKLDLKDKGSKDIVKNALKDNPSVDIALFGRMAASDPTLNCDAAAQVAHAISTHAVQNEYDYFTAVDDLQEEDNAGAGHLGTVEFNSSTLYRYATVNASELAETIGKENTAETVRKFGQAFICSMPTGMSNTFANNTLPDTVYVTIRTDQPVNLCGAFEKPIKKSNEGYAAESEKRLAEYAAKLYSRYDTAPVKEYGFGDSLGAEVVTLPLPKLLSELEKAVTDLVNEV
mgnify:CR=1 FL=1